MSNNTQIFNARPGMNKSSTYFLNGRQVRVLATDPDPSAAWWVCYDDDPDTDAFVLRSELEERQ